MRPPVNAAPEEMNRIRPNPRSRMEGTAHCASRNGGAQVHRQHLIELGGGDVLQRLDVAQPGIADQHVHRAQRFGGRRDELTGGLRAAQVGADRERPAACRGDLRRERSGGLSLGAVAEP
jgi:hypothetical protein